MGRGLQGLRRVSSESSRGTTTITSSPWPQILSSILFKIDTGSYQAFLVTSDRHSTNQGLNHPQQPHPQQYRSQDLVARLLSSLRQSDIQLCHDFILARHSQHSKSGTCQVLVQHYIDSKLTSLASLTPQASHITWKEGGWVASRFPFPSSSTGTFMILVLV